MYLKELEIVPCLGCYTCWTRTPGVCVHKDDMPPLLVKMRQADVTIYATPLYVFTVTGIMKDFMDRHIPNLQPHIVKRGEHYLHPPRYPDARDRRLVLLSNCGFPERHHFDALVETFEQMTQGPDAELIATILCTAGELLRQPALRGDFDWYLEAARLAGREIVERGHITRETQTILDRDLVDPETLSRMANAHWNARIGTVPDPTTMGTEPGIPMPLPTAPPTTLRETIAGMPSALNAEAAKGLQAVIQYNVSGDEPGQYYLRISDGTCSAYQGAHPSPTLAIHTPSDVWLRVSRGELSGSTAMLQGLYTIDGDLNLLTRMNSLFAPAGSGRDSSTQAVPTPPTAHGAGVDNAPTSAREAINGMPSAFNPARAGDLQAIIQFHVTGSDPGEYHLRIADGTCVYSEGIADDATTTIATPSEVWLAVARGEMDGARAMVRGLYSVSGDLSLMMRMEGLFSGAEAGAAQANVLGGPLPIPGMTWLTVAFVPWIVHWVLGGMGLGPLWNIGLPFALSAAIWLYRRTYITTTWLDTGSPIWFAVAGLFRWLASGFWATYGGVLGSLAMAGMWMGTLATDTPLTADYSRWKVPPELARDALFIKTNAILTAFWAAVFLLQAAIELAGVASSGHENAWIVFRYATLIPAFWFTSWFQKWYPAHVAANSASSVSKQEAMLA
jgi:putative sterol carrier protein